MINVFKNNKGDIAMTFTDESQIHLKGTLANVLEELRIVAGGDVITNVDVERCEVIIADLQMLFGELID